MGTYGPYTSVLGTVVSVNGLDPNADRLFIVNESIYTLAIGFGDSPPPAVASLTGEPWMFSVPPGGQVVPIPTRLFGGSHYNGKVYVLALDPISASKAYTGTRSNNAAFFVLTLLSEDAAPGNYSTPQAMDLASQPRVIAIPAVSPAWGAADPAYNNAQVGSYLTNNFVFLWNTGLSSLPSQFIFYLYAAYFSFEQAPTAISQIGLVIRETHSGAETANHVFFRQAFTGDVFTAMEPAAPLAIGFTPAGTTDALAMAVFLYGYSNGVTGAVMHISAWAMVDWVTSQHIPAIGQSTLFTAPTVF